MITCFLSQLLQNCRAARDEVKLVVRPVHMSLFIYHEAWLEEWHYLPNAAVITSHVVVPASPCAATALIKASLYNNRLDGLCGFWPQV